MDVLGEQIDPEQLARFTGDPTVLAGFQQVTLHQGVAEGVRAIQVRTSAGLEFSILLDRACDVADARFAGVPFGWRSGTGYRHPGLHEHHDENGLSWLRSFDGLLMTAGLDHILFGDDVAADQYAYPPRRVVSHGIHGRVTAIPARLLECRQDGNIIRVTADITQSAVFAERLRLTRTIECDIDGTQIRLLDQVENLGYDRTPHMFLYHLNFGWPLVAPGTRFWCRRLGELWRSPSVDEQGHPWDRFAEPIDGFVEQVYEHELAPDVDGWHRVAVVRADGRLGMELAWDASTMPYFFEWLNLRTGQYAVGLEPSTHHVAGEAAARADGSMIWLEHGESRTYRSTITLFSGTAEADRRIASIREGSTS